MRRTFDVNLRRILLPGLASCILSSIAVAGWVPDPDAGTITLDKPLVTVYEDYYQATFVARRLGGSDGRVSVHFRQQNGTAVAGSDFQIRTGEIVWDDGDSAPKYIYIPITQDTSVEPDESFTFEIYGPTYGASLGDITSAQATIVTRDQPRLPSYVHIHELGDSSQYVASDVFLNADNAGIGVGDTDGDGREDLVIGAPWESVDSCAEGSMYLIDNLAPHSGSVALRTASDTLRSKFDGWGAKSTLGSWIVGLGDVDGDGLSDFISRKQQSITLDHGEAFLLYGKKGGVAGRSLDTLSPTNDGIRIYDSSSDFVDVSSIASAGDFNADGYDDYLVTAYYYGGTSQRITFLIQGSATRLTGSYLDLDALLSTEAYRFIDGAISAKSVGDINGDGFDDMLFDFGSGGNDYIVYGYYSYPTEGSSPETVQWSSVAKTSLEDYDYDPAGDVNGDGFDDLIARTKTGDSSGEGLVSVIFGNAAGLLSNIDCPDDINGTNGVNLVSSEAFTVCSGVGDVNGDGYGDVMVSNPSPQQDDALYKAYLIYGSSTGLGLTRTPSSGDFNVDPVDGENVVAFVDMPNGGILEYNRAFATSISNAGDFDEDGVSDLLIGTSPLELVDASQMCVEDPGESYLLYGAGSTLSPSYSEFVLHQEVAIGNIKDGSHSVPFSRCWIDYYGGTLSKETVTLHRNKTGISNLGDLPKVANVYWRHQSTRTNYSAAYLRFKYLDSEVAGLDEMSLRMYRASDLSGPWELIDDQAIDVGQNTILVNLGFDEWTSGDLGYFSIRDAELIHIEDGDFVANGQKWQALGMCYDRVQLDLVDEPRKEYARGEAFPIFGEEFILDFLGNEGIEFVSVEDQVFDSPSLTKYASYTIQEIDAIWAAYQTDIDDRFDALDEELTLLESKGINTVQSQLPDSLGYNPVRLLPCYNCSFTDRNIVSVTSEDLFYSNLNRFLRLCKDHNMKVEFHPRHGYPGNKEEGAEPMTWPYSYSQADPFAYDGETRRFIERIKDRVEPDLWGTIAGWTLTWETLFLYNYNDHANELQILDWFYYEDKYARRSIYVKEEDFVNSYCGWLDQQWRQWLVEQYGSLLNAQTEFGESVDFTFSIHVDTDNDGDYDTIQAVDPDYYDSTISTRRIQAFRRFTYDLTARLYNKMVMDLKKVDSDHYYTTKILGTFYQKWDSTGVYNQRALNYALDVSGLEFYSVAWMLMKDIGPGTYKVDESYVNGVEMSIYPYMDDTDTRYSDIEQAVIAHVTFLTRYFTFGGLKPNVFDEGGFRKAFRWDTHYGVDSLAQEDRQKVFYELFLPALDYSDSDGAFFFNYFGSPECYSIDTGSGYWEDWGLVDYEPKDPALPHTTVRDALDEIGIFQNDISYTSLNRSRYERNATVLLDEAECNNFQAFGRNAVESIVAMMSAEKTKYIEVLSAGSGAQSNSSDWKDFLLVGDKHSITSQPSTSRPGPLKYFNSVIDRIEVLNRGVWKDVKDGDVLHVDSSSPVKARVIVGNSAEGRWDMANTKFVTKKIDSSGVVTDLFTYDINDDITTFERCDFGTITLAPAESGKRDIEVNLRFLGTPLGDREFGERIRFTVDSNNVTDYYDFDRENSQELDGNWTVANNSDPDHFVIEDGALVYGLNGANTKFADLSALRGVEERVYCDLNAYTETPIDLAIKLKFDLKWSQAQDGEFDDAPCTSSLSGYPTMNYFTTEGDVTQFLLSFDSTSTTDNFQLISKVNEITGASQTDLVINGATQTPSLMSGSGYTHAAGYRAECHVEIETTPSSIIVVINDENGSQIASQTYSVNFSNVNNDMSIGFGMISDVSYRGCDRVTPKPSDYAGFRIDNVELVYPEK